MGQSAPTLAMHTYTAEAHAIADWSLAVRESTIKRLRLVPAGRENWAPAPGAMSFSDIAQHVVDADCWLFNKLERSDLPPMVGTAGLKPITRNEFLAVVQALHEAGEARVKLIYEVSSDLHDKFIFDSRYGREVSIWWLIVRGNLDHEIHHRGQLAVYLRLLGTNRANG